MTQLLYVDNSAYLRMETVTFESFLKSFENFLVLVDYFWLRREDCSCAIFILQSLFMRYVYHIVIKCSQCILPRTA